MTAAEGASRPGGAAPAPLLIFDVGGVMVDGFDVMPAMAAEFGLELQALERKLDAADVRALHDGTLAVAEFWRRLEARTGLRPRGEPWGDYFGPIRRPAMYALVERARRVGLRVVAGTNTIDPHYEAHMRRGDYDVFDHVYASNLMGVSKPDPEFWRRILAAEGAEPAATLFVDDLPENVAGAAGLGIRAVRFESVEQVVGVIDGVLAAAR